MASAVEDPDTEAALRLIEAGFAALDAAGVEPADADDAATIARRLAVISRRSRAFELTTQDSIDRRGLFKDDGHRSAKAMVRHVARLGDEEAGRRAKAVKALRDLPAVKGRYLAGEIGSDHLDVIARAHANKRVREKLIAQDHRMARLAVVTPLHEFAAIVRDWVRLTDEDGTLDRSRWCHENRDHRLVQDHDGGWAIKGRCGTLDGAEADAILARFERLEFEKDWAEARDRLGDAATASDLQRTAAQRRWDAYMAAMRAAATVEAGREGGSVIETNIVIDQHSFERQLARMQGVPVVVPDVDLEDLVSGGQAVYRSSTFDGRQVDIADATAAALTGYIRRVVVGADSVTIDLGRRGRLFVGGARKAVQATRQTCIWPGCDVPVSRCQVDHIDPWSPRGDPGSSAGGGGGGGGGSPGGETDPANGAPLCGFHNRVKEQGYRVTRDEAGNLHVHRPDGREVA